MSTQNQPDPHVGLVAKVTFLFSDGADQTLHTALFGVPTNARVGRPTTPLLDYLELPTAVKQIVRRPAMATLV